MNQKSMAIVEEAIADQGQQSALDPSALLDPKQAGEYLGGEGAPFSYAGLARWRSEGRGPRYVKVGPFVRYRVSDLDAWLKAQTVTPGSAA